MKLFLSTTMEWVNCITDLGSYYVKEDVYITLGSKFCYMMLGRGIYEKEVGSQQEKNVEQKYREIFVFELEEVRSMDV